MIAKNFMCLMTGVSALALCVDDVQATTTPADNAFTVSINYLPPTPPPAAPSPDPVAGVVPAPVNIQPPAPVAPSPAPDPAAQAALDAAAKATADAAAAKAVSDAVDAAKIAADAAAAKAAADAAAAAKADSDKKASTDATDATNAVQAALKEMPTEVSTVKILKDNANAAINQPLAKVQSDAAVIVAKKVTDAAVVIQSSLDKINAALLASPGNAVVTKALDDAKQAKTTSDGYVASVNADIAAAAAVIATKPAA